MGRRAFTVLELLVAIAIIAILAGLLFPVLGSAKKRAKVTTCTSNMRQLGQALQIYRQDFDQRIPYRLSGLYPAYTAENASIFRCPLDPKEGKYPDTGRLEGSAYIGSGVSYSWVPNWNKAIAWGWWRPWPNRGVGKWADQTPVAECHWHWATKYSTEWINDQNELAKENALILVASGDVLRWPGSLNMSEFTPER